MSHRLSDISWEEFHKITPADKTPYLVDNGRPVHVLLAHQFNREQLDMLGTLATQVRFIAKDKAGMKFLLGLLPHKRAMLYFSQPSTRREWHGYFLILTVRFQ